MTDLPESEFSRIIDIRHIEDKPLVLEPTPEEAAALAKRFSIVSISLLQATLTLSREGAMVVAKGRMKAAFVQSCAISAEDLPQKVDEALLLRFVPDSQQEIKPDEEIELSDSDCDDIPYTGERFDLGEAVAQSFALSIDPFAEGPLAAKVRASGVLGAENNSPFAALAALKPKE
jgi:uncharacterized metal-binding protein YceD (DUF177 family)